MRELINKGWVSESDYATTVSETFCIDLLGAEHLPNPALTGTEDLRSFLHDNEALPLSLNDGVLLLAVTDPSCQFVLQVLRAKLGHEIEMCVMQRTELLDALDVLYPISVVDQLKESATTHCNTDVELILNW